MNREYTYVRHIVGEMTEEGIQGCVICGEIITDYRGAMVPEGTPPLRGFDAGDIYVLKGNPTITQTGEPERFILCSDQEKPTNDD
jgi:hypothetical protein